MLDPPKLELELQKLGHRALDDIIALARRIERLQKDYPSLNKDNLVSVLQDELCAVCKEFQESAADMADKVVQVAQPVIAPAKPADLAMGSMALFWVFSTLNPFASIGG